MMASSAKRFVSTSIPIVQNATKSALSMVNDSKCTAKQLSVLLRSINTATGRIKKSAASVAGGEENGMVTMTKSSPSSQSSVHVEVSNSSSINNKSNSNIDLLSATPSESGDSKNDKNNASELSSIQDNNSITISPSAVKQIHQLAIRKRPDAPSNLYLRVYVDAGGCSGFEYKFELEFKDDDNTPIDLEEDVIIQASLNDGSMPIEVVVDQSSLELISGCTVDFTKEMIRSSFVILDNPHSESACGCGSSFAVKNFAATAT